MTKYLVATSPQTVEWKTVDDIPVTGGKVKVKSEWSAAKHGTEVAFLTGKPNALGSWDDKLQIFRREAHAGQAQQTVWLGNCTVGHVTETGPEVTGLSVGERVMVYEVFFAAEHVVEACRCYKMPEQMAWESAVCLDPAVFALGAVRDGHIRVGDRVAVFGLGAIGLMAVQLAKIAGASQVAAVDPIAGRRDIAAKLGADIVIDPSAGHTAQELKLALDQHGADVCIDFSGHVSALQAALGAVAFGGTVVYGAFPGPFPAGLNFGAESHLNIPNLVFSRACSAPDRDSPRWDLTRIKETCWKLLQDGALTGVPVVEPIVDFDDLPEQYAQIVLNPAAGVKLGVRHF